MARIHCRTHQKRGESRTKYVEPHVSRRDERTPTRDPRFLAGLVTQGKLDKLSPAEWVALERAKRAAKLAPILAAAKAELERQLSAGMITTRGGRKTRSAHLSHMAVEAADE